MAFQPMNFAGISPMGLSGVRNLAPTIGQGMQVGMMPAQEKRAAQQAELANALQRLKMQYLPQEFQSEQALRAAQTQKASQEAGQHEMLRNILSQRLSGASGSGAGAGSEELGEALFRKLVGIPTELPGEQQSRELSTFKQKEKWKKDLEQQGGDVLTGQSKTKMQNTLGALDRVIPDMEDLIKITPDKLSFEGRAAWNRKKNLITDKLMKAQELGANVPQLETIKEILNRNWNESKSNYLQDMQGLLDDLKSQRGHARSSLEAGKVLPYEPENKNEVQATKSIGGKTYFKRGGKWYEQ